MNCLPYKGAKLQDITQKFSDSHKAIDWCPPNPYGKFLVAPCNGRICSIVNGATLNEDSTELGKGWGIMVSEDDSSRYYVYWHCLPEFPVNLWQTVKQGQAIAQMGNSGKVFNNGVEVPATDEARDKPPYPGTHLHQEVFTLNPDGTRNYIDPITLIDLSILINPNILEAIKQTLLNMLKILKVGGK